MELKNLFLDGVLFTSITIGLLSLIFLSRLKKHEKYLGYYAILIAFFESLARILKSNFKINNLLGLHIYTLLEFFILVIFFFYILKKLDFKLPIKKIIIIGGLLIISNSIFFQPFHVFPSNSRIAVEFFIILLCIFYLVLMIKYTRKKNSYKPINLFISAILVKSSFSSVLYLFSNSIMKMQTELRDQLWTFRVFINLVATILIMMAIVTIIKRSFKVNEYRPNF